MITARKVFNALMPVKALLLACEALVLFSIPAVAQEFGSIESGLRASLTPKRFTTLSAEMDGLVEKVTVHEGDAIKNGRLLVAFDCGEEKAILDKSRAAFKFAEKDVKVNRRLDELGTTSTMKLHIAESKVAEARADLKVSEVKVGRCRVIAPFSGRVAELFVRQHQFAKRGDPLMKILDSSDLEVEMIVPSDWLAWLKPGLAFSLKLDETGQFHAAEVTTIGSWIDPVSRSIKVFGKIDDNGSNLLPGMSGRAMIRPPKTQ